MKHLPINEVFVLGKNSQIKNSKIIGDFLSVLKVNYENLYRYKVSKKFKKIFWGIYPSTNTPIIGPIFFLIWGFIWYLVLT